MKNVMKTEMATWKHYAGFVLLMIFARPNA